MLVLNSRFIEFVLVMNLVMVWMLVDCVWVVILLIFLLCLCVCVKLLVKLWFSFRNCGWKCVSSWNEFKFELNCFSLIWQFSGVILVRNCCVLCRCVNIFVFGVCSYSCLLGILLVSSLWCRVVIICGLLNDFGVIFIIMCVGWLVCLCLFRMLIVWVIIQWLMLVSSLCFLVMFRKVVGFSSLLLFFRCRQVLYSFSVLFCRFSIGWQCSWNLLLVRVLWICVIQCWMCFFLIWLIVVGLKMCVVLFSFDVVCVYLVVCVSIWLMLVIFLLICILLMFIVIVVEWLLMLNILVV